MSQSSSKKIPLIIITLLIFIAGVWFFYYGQQTSRTPSVTQPLMSVEVSKPLFKRLVEWDEYAGRFQASEKVEIRARVSGYLQKIHFQDGEKVKKDQILFTIDQRPFMIALDRAESQLVRATREYDRTKSLRKTRMISEQELDNDFQELRDAKANLNQAKLNLEFTEVKSPIAGRVSRNRVDVGNLITGGESGTTLLTTVVSIDPINFYIETSERDVLKYIELDKAGFRESSRTRARPAYVKLQDEDDFVHQGYIDFVDNEIDPATGTLETRAVFDNKDELLLPGIFGRMRIAGSQEYEAMLVPERAIGINQTLKFVYIVNADNKIEPRTVKTGPLHAREWRIIRQGLKPDDRVVTSGLTILRPGLPVNAQEITLTIPNDAMQGK